MSGIHKEGEAGEFLQGMGLSEADIAAVQAYFKAEISVRTTRLLAWVALGLGIYSFLFLLLMLLRI